MSERPSRSDHVDPEPAHLTFVPDHGRRRAPAGHAVIVLAIALLLASLLNARGMHKTAAEQPPGSGRDAALWLSSAWVDLSSAFLLDKPRSLVKDALGRSDDDTVSSTIRFHQPVLARGGQAVASVPRPVFTAAHPMRLYVTGDSLMTDPSSILFDLATSSNVIAPVGPADIHAATGLAQPETFNWFEHLPQQAKALRPNLVVITIGGNDGLDLSGTGGGQQFGTDAWRIEYGRRVGGVMDDFIADGAKVVWVGLPITRDANLSARYRLMNQLYAAEVRLRSHNAAFVDIYSRFADSQGNYADYLPDASGQLVHLRASDGIHYDTPGATIVAHAIAHAMSQLVDLRTTDADFAPLAAAAPSR